MGLKLPLIERVANEITAVLIEDKTLSDASRERLIRAQADAARVDISQRQVINLMRLSEITDYTQRRMRQAGMDDDAAD